MKPCSKKTRARERRDVSMEEIAHSEETQEHLQLCEHLFAMRCHAPICHICLPPVFFATTVNGLSDVRFLQRAYIGDVKDIITFGTFFLSFARPASGRSAS